MLEYTVVPAKLVWDKVVDHLIRQAMALQLVAVRYRAADRDEEIDGAPFERAHRPVRAQGWDAFERAVMLEHTPSALRDGRTAAWAITIHQVLLGAGEAVVMQRQDEPRAAPRLQRQERVDQPVVRVDDVGAFLGDDALQRQ